MTYCPSHHTPYDEPGEPIFLTYGGKTFAWTEDDILFIQGEPDGPDDDGFRRIGIFLYCDVDEDHDELAVLTDYAARYLKENP